MSRRPAILTLDNGVLFAEIDSNESDKTILVVYYPFVAEITPTNLRLTRWVPFSDDIRYSIPAHKVLNIASMDEDHLKMYGTIVMGLELNRVKEEVADMLKVNYDLGTRIENAFDDTLYTMAELGLRYKLAIPEYDIVKSSFYSFVYTTMSKGDNYVSLRQ